MFGKCFFCAGSAPGTVMGLMSFHPNYPVRHQMISYHLADVAGGEVIHQDLTQSVHGRSEMAPSWC